MFLRASLSYSLEDSNPRLALFAEREYHEATNAMDALFAVLFLLSIAGLVVGLTKPQWVRMPSKESAGWVFGVAAVVFLIGFGQTSPSAQNAQTAVQAAQLAQSATNSTTSASEASSSSSVDFSAPLTAAQQQQFDDTDFVVDFNGVIVPDFAQVGAPLTTFGQDVIAYDYSGAISDLQGMRSALQTTQTDLQSADQAYAPLSPDVAHIDKLTSDAVLAGLKGVSTCLTDLENGDIGAADDASAQYLSGTMFNDLMSARAAAASWTANNTSSGNGQ